jgi:hypothetical protein
LATIPGFIQTIATTKCGLGLGVHKVNLPGDIEWVGSEGVFVFDLANQSSFCLTNPLRPLKGPKPASEISEVKQYFLGVGLPASQLGPVGTTFETDSAGEGYVSAVIKRSIEGVPVRESRAWAALVDGQSLGEGVYWPALPASVSEELMELRAIVASSNSLAVFQSRLPIGFVSGSIVIHHSDVSQRVPGHPGQEITFVAHACYDAVIAQNGDLGITRCYLPDGSEFAFPPPGA